MQPVVWVMGVAATTATPMTRTENSVLVGADRLSSHERRGRSEENSASGGTTGGNTGGSDADHSILELLRVNATPRTSAPVAAIGDDGTPITDGNGEPTGGNTGGAIRADRPMARVQGVSICGQADIQAAVIGSDEGHENNRSGGATGGNTGGSGDAGDASGPSSWKPSSSICRPSWPARMRRSSPKGD